MATFQIKTPQGKLVEVEAPDMAAASAAVQQMMAHEPGSMTDTTKNIGRGMLRGLRDIPDQGAALATHGLEALAPEGSWFHRWAQAQREMVDKVNRDAENDYQQNWSPKAPGAEIGRTAGQVIGAAPIAAAVPGAAAPGLLARTGSGVVSGALTGALQPGDQNAPPGDFWSDKTKQAAAGTVGGAIAPAVVGTAARIVKPNTSPNVRTLLDEGVSVTPGQILGGAANRIEQGLQSVPLVGDMIAGARRNAITTFDRAAINRALSPIGQSLDPKTPMGREAIIEGKDKISAAYDRLLPQLQVQADPQFIHNLQGVISLSSHLEPGLDAQFRKILSDKVMRSFAVNGRMTGESFKTVESELGRLAQNYNTSSVASERELGGALRQVQQEMRDLLERSNPNHADELRGINSAFSNFLRIENAASKVGAQDGAFTPSHLVNATRALDSSRRKGAFSRGEAQMQDFAEAGRDVLGSTVPDSGTPYRAYVGLPALLAGASHDPTGLSWAPMVGATGVGAAYTPPAQATLRALLAQRPGFATPLSNAIRSSQPLSTPLAAILAQQSGQQQP